MITFPQLDAMHVLEKYYQSIESQFDRTHFLRRKNDPVESLAFATLYLFVFSVIPIFPHFLWKTIPSLLERKSLPVAFWEVNLQSFWLWWVLAVLTVGSWLYIVFKRVSVRAQRRVEESLPLPQMRFAYCYAVFDELRKFETNKLTRHIDKAMNYFDELMQEVRFLVFPFDINADRVESMALGAEGIVMVSARKGIRLQLLDQLKTRYGWFRLSEDTERILRAFETMPMKLGTRLKDKKDLPQLSDCLLNLASYLYSMIPELHQTPIPAEGRLGTSSFGLGSLRAFAEKLEILPEYLPEPQKQPRETRVKDYFLRLQGSIAGVFAHQNMLLCFIAWYVLCLALVCTAVMFARVLIPELKLDSVLVSTVVGVPIAAAVTALAISRRKRQDKSN